MLGCRIWAQLRLSPLWCFTLSRCNESLFSLSQHQEIQIRSAFPEVRVSASTGSLPRGRNRILSPPMCPTAWLLPPSFVSSAA
uniref:Secreted protein n=1 Tax=Gallus gallus TaxID=9031 RepID=A0A8V0Z2P0_CHICK